MAAFKDLIDANVALKEYDDIPWAVSHPSSGDIAANKLEVIKLLTAKRCLLEGHVIKETPEVTTSVVTEGNVLDKLGDTTVQVIAERKLNKFISASRNVENLFLSPEQQLSYEQVCFKERLSKLMIELGEEELHLNTIQKKIEEAAMRRDQVLRTWDEKLAKLQNDVTAEAQNGDENDDPKNLPGKKKLRDVITKLDLMKFLISQFITFQGYDWVTDRVNLKRLLPLIRENFTIEMFDE